MTPETAPPPLHPLDASIAEPPRAQHRPHRFEIHGRAFEDPFAWLRERDDPAVRTHLDAENAYAEAVLAPTLPTQRALYDEMLSHIKETDLSVPYRRGSYWYYARTEAGKQYPIYARKRGTLDAPEEITLDLNVLAEGLAYLGIGDYVVSDDEHLLAYSVDTTGYRQYVLHVKDLRTGALSREAIPRVTSVAWSADSRTLFYVSEDETSKRSDRFWRHALGAASSELVYEEADERYDLWAARTNDRAYVLFGAHSKATTEWWALRADDPAGAPFVIAPRRDGHRYSPEHRGASFFIVTNDVAIENRIVVAPDDAPGEANWRELVPERDGVHVSDLDVFATFAIVRGRRDGYESLEVLDLETGALREVALPEAVHDVGSQPNPEFAATTYRFAYSSLVTPNSVFELDPVSGARTLLKETEVPHYDRARYASDVRYATAPDGTRIPISLVARRDVPRDGSAPLLLYGYGSYGHPIDPTFSPARLALLDRGVTFAIAHVRGGGELGERWRTAGHLQAKRTTFDDFVTCAEFLIAERYTNASRLAIQGGSAGGLLVAAVTNMRPDLFRAVVAQVPFVDVLNTMLDASLPLTTAEYLEWGDPNVADDFAYMATYSPYDNVPNAAFPAMLVRVSYYDSQVPFWEGAKLVARIRAHDRGDGPILLLTNFGAGHGGASGRYDYLREQALNYAFVLAEIASDAAG